MLLELINRVLITLLFMSWLTLIRHVYYFIQAFLTSTEEQPVKYKISKTSLLFLCISLAYIFSVFITGIKIS